MQFCFFTSKIPVGYVGFRKKIYTLPLKPTKPRVIVLRKMGMSVAQLATAFRQSILYVLRARLSLFHINFDYTPWSSKILKPAF